MHWLVLCTQTKTLHWFGSGLGGLNGTVVLPEENQQGAPKRREEGLFYAGYTQVLGVGRVQTLKGEQTQRQQLICNDRQ